MEIILIKSYTEKPWRDQSTYQMIESSLKKKWAVHAIETKKPLTLINFIKKIQQDQQKKIFVFNIAEYLDEKNVPPVDVKLRGVYRDKEIELDIHYCISEDGNWLKRPNICKSLEEQYKLTMEECYKGHTGVEDCLYNDRETKGSGPY